MDFVPVSRVVLCVGGNVYLIPSVLQVVYLHFSDDVNRVDDDDDAFSVKTGIQSPPKAAPDVTSETTIHVRVSTAMILRTSTSDLNS